MPTGSRQGKGFVRDFVGVSLGNYGAITLSFALNVILTRRLGVEQFGRLALLIMAVQVLSCLTTNWTVTALIRFGAQEHAASGSVADIFWARVRLVAPWIASAAVLLAVAQDPAKAYFDVTAAGVWLLFGYFLLNSLLISLGAVFQAAQQMERYAITLFADKAIAVLGVLLLPAWLAHDAVSVIGCYALSSLLVSLWSLAVVGRRMLLPVRMSRGTVGRLWAFSLPMIVSTLAGLVGTQWIQYAVIKHYLPFHEIGLYSLANQVAGVVQQVTIISSTLLLPHFSVLVTKQQDQQIATFVEKVIPHGLLVFSLGLSVLVLLMPPAVPLIFGPDFAGSVPPLALLMVATMGLALFNTFMALSYAWGDTWTVTVITMASAAVNFGAALLLVQSHGIQGVAVATVLGHGTAALMILAAVQRRLGVRTLRFALLALPVALATLCSFLFEGTYLYYLAGAGAAVLSTVLLIVSFGLFRRETLPLLFGGEGRLPVMIKSGLKAFSQRTG